MGSGQARSKRDSDVQPRAIKLALTRNKDARIARLALESCPVQPRAIRSAPTRHNDVGAGAYKGGDGCVPSVRPVGKGRQEQESVSVLTLGLSLNTLYLYRKSLRF